MYSSITEYINSGDYPDWPYRGAEKIEEVYKEAGLPGVREVNVRSRGTVHPGRGSPSRNPAQEPGAMGGKWMRTGCSAPITAATGIANANGSTTASG